MNVNLSLLYTDSIAPTYATEGSGAFDFYAHEYAQASYGQPAVIGTGVAMEIPPQHSLLVFSRSGHGFKHNVRLSNCVGVIDSDYRGEIFVKLTLDAPSYLTSFPVQKGDRIAQGLIVYTPKIKFTEVKTLSETKRGSLGLGSTGGVSAAVDLTGQAFKDQA